MLLIKIRCQLSLLQAAGNDFGLREKEQNKREGAEV